MHIGISGIAYHLPEAVLDNAALGRQFPRFHPEKVKAKTGIDRRHIAAPDECASDLAAAAAERLLLEVGLSADAIDYLIFCTQAPDYFLPTTACLIHRQLGLRSSAGAIDVNLGCSGFVYGLGLAGGLIASGQAQRVLLLTADTYSKFIDAGDVSVRSIFGDGAAATLIEDRSPRSDDGMPGLGPFVYGSDGTGAHNLIVRGGGMRHPAVAAGASFTDHWGDERKAGPLYMNGPEIFNFTLGAVPQAVEQLLTKAGIGLSDIDLFVFHQANLTMLEALRRKINIEPARFYLALDDGNTVSSTIPIALRRALDEGRLRPGMRVMLVGFGVGYSWAAALMRWI